MSKCNKCKYEYSSKLDEPCKYCREKCGIATLGYQISEDKFVPKEEQSTIEHNGCMGCVYEDFEEFDEPCINCKGTYKHDTMAYLKAKDYFKPKEEKADDEIDMVNHLQNEYLHDLNVLKELVDKADSFEWIPFTFDEEGILNCELPDIDEDILVWDVSGMFDKENVWVDTWESPDFGVYELESGMDLEGLAWMPFPQPNKEQLGYEN